MFILERIKSSGKLGAAVTLYVFSAPVLKGLFNKELFYMHFIGLLALFIFMIFTRKHIFVDKRLTLFLLLQAGISFSSIFTGINREEAIYGFFEIMMPFVLFIVMLNLCEDTSLRHEKAKSLQEDLFKKLVDKILLAIFVSGTLVSVFNLVFASFAPEIVSGESSEVLRLQYIIEYANTLAVFLFVSSIIGFYFMRKDAEVSTARQAMIRVGTALIISSMILTFSRAVWILSIVFYIIYFSVLKSKRISFEWIVLCCISIITVFIILSSLWKLTWAAIIVLVLLVLLEHRSFGFFEGVLSRFSRKKGFTPVILIAFAIITVAGIALLLINSGHLYQRLLSISINASELQERFAYYRDSLKIVKDFPLLGTGAGGWESIQYHYQTALYAVRYVHSSIIQEALDYGILGLIIFVGQICLFFYYTVLGYKKSRDFKDLRLLVITVGLINAFILFHSLIDLDFEFPVINMIFWVNIGILSRIWGNAAKIHLEGKKRKAFLSFAALFLILAQIPLMVSSIYYSMGISSFRQKSYQDAKKHFYMASVFNPFSSDAYLMRGEAIKMIYYDSREESLRLEGIKCYSLARKYDRYNPNYPAGISYISRIAGDYEVSILEYKRLIQLQPLVIGYYEALARTLLEKAENKYKSGNKEDAVIIFKEIIDIESEVKTAAKKVSEFGRLRAKHRTNLTLTKRLALIIGKAYYYLGEEEKSEYYMGIASKEEID